MELKARYGNHPFAASIECVDRFGRIEMRTLILSVLFVLAVVGAGIAAFGHTIPGFEYQHDTDSELSKPNTESSMLCT